MEKTKFSDKKECERCHYRYLEKDLQIVKLDDGESWLLCGNCIEDIKEVNE